MGEIWWNRGLVSCSLGYPCGWLISFSWRFFLWLALSFFALAVSSLSFLSLSLSLFLPPVRLSLPFSLSLFLPLSARVCGVQPPADPTTCAFLACWILALCLSGSSNPDRLLVFFSHRLGFLRFDIALLFPWKSCLFVYSLACLLDINYGESFLSLLTQSAV